MSQRTVLLSSLIQLTVRARAQIDESVRVELGSADEDEVSPLNKLVFHSLSKFFPFLLFHSLISTHHFGPVHSV